MIAHTQNNHNCGKTKKKILLKLLRETKMDTGISENYMALTERRVMRYQSTSNKWEAHIYHKQKHRA
jgi:hypothetical protein